MGEVGRRDTGEVTGLLQQSFCGVLKFGVVCWIDFTLDPRVGHSSGMPVGVVFMVALQVLWCRYRDVLHVTAPRVLR